MKIAWFGLYVLASIWIVGMVISATGLPFGPRGLASAPKVAVAGPASVAPAAQVAAGARTVGHEDADQMVLPTAAPMPIGVRAAAEHPSHARVAVTEQRGSQLLEPRLEGDIKVFDLEAAPMKWEVLPGHLRRRLGLQRPGHWAAAASHRGRQDAGQPEEPPARADRDPLPRPKPPEQPGRCA